MRYAKILSLFFLVLSLNTGCWFVRQDENGKTNAEKTGEAIQAVAPFLPAPFGYIATSAATVLSAIGVAAAKRIKDKAMIGAAAVEALNTLPPETKAQAATAVRKQTRMYNVSGLLEEMAATADKEKK